ncbi:MAG: hypothetical protein KC978_16385, partial [Candidatus Omnitrophica bacterium]|nr:hypothetical protein [Candidatus Omnitrophota bacterium]
MEKRKLKIFVGVSSMFSIHSMGFRDSKFIGHTGNNYYRYLHLLAIITTGCIPIRLDIQMPWDARPQGHFLKIGNE